MDETLRLEDDEARTIRRAVTETFGPDARVYLFGSRTDDAARGGDIDLYIETGRVPDDRVAALRRLHALLTRALGKREIDVVVRDPRTPLAPVHRVARRQGIPL